MREQPCRVRSCQPRRVRLAMCVCAHALQRAPVRRCLMANWCIWQTGIWQNVILSLFLMKFSFRFSSQVIWISRWFKRQASTGVDRSVFPETDRDLRFVGGSLFLPRVDKVYHEGLWTCHAKNELGYDNKTIKLTVTGEIIQDTFPIFWLTPLLKLREKTLGANKQRHIRFKKSHNISRNIHLSIFQLLSLWKSILTDFVSMLAMR